jgi:hypothetical protein
MISRPIDAIINAKGGEELGKVMADIKVFKTHYPTFTYKDWVKWMAKYKSFPTAKQCAVSMYYRLSK